MKIWKGLLIGHRGLVAIGRFWLCACLLLAVYFWFARPVESFPPTLENIIGFLLAYNLGGKFTGRNEKNDDPN
ncbi:hypothetical protein C4J81_11505 [Deltaproteobacteria bacterium Smac51]|nr:hypothetical protein C4J81_11505 [Deltaproteobacteria bacterium Smac51]